MKKRLLTATLVASCAGLLVYTAFYQKGIDIGLAQKHQNTQADYKKYTPTNKANQINAFNRLLENHVVAIADNTNITPANILPIATNNEVVYANQKLAVDTKPAYLKYTVASNTATRITNAQTGTRLTIKPNTFVNEFGEVAEGMVHITLREMHTAAEFFLGQLPMNGYESAGVIELNATAENGNTLYIDNNKPVEVLMASANVDENYAVYQLGAKMDSWKLKNAGLQTLAPAKANTKVKYSQANVSLAEVRSGFHLFKKELSFKMQLNPQVFPEMQAYNDVAWVYTGKHSKQISKKLLKDLANPYGSRRRGNLFFNYWNDVKVLQTETGEYRMVFTLGQEELAIAVKPENMYGHPINPEAMYEEYTKLLADKKVKNTDKEIFEEANSYDADALPKGFSKMVRFTIDECGTWGIHRTANYGNSLKTNISFTDEKGVALNITKLYQYDPAINTYQQIDLSQALAMQYNSAANNVIFAITGNNEVALLNKKAFAELVSKVGAAYPLTAKLARKPINTVGDVLALFNS